MSKIQVISTETPEKYQAYQEKILPWFLEMMHQYVVEITPLMSRCHELCDLNRNGQYSDEIRDITQNALTKKRGILAGHISEQIYISSGDTYPTRFHYFDTDCSVHFIMKTLKKAVVIAHTIDSYSSDVWHKFEFRPKEDSWILDKIYLSYESQDGPYKKIDF